MKETLFVCWHCGYEDTYETDEDTKELECPHCRFGIMYRDDKKIEYKFKPSEIDTRNG
jgi:DNA-directed RNA polymerase subunit RPC12/RpoP